MKLKNLPARCGKICLAGCPVYLPLDKHITKRYVLHLEHLLNHFDFCSGLYSKNIRVALLCPVNGSSMLTYELVSSSWTRQSKRFCFPVRSQLS